MTSNTVLQTILKTLRQQQTNHKKHLKATEALINMIEKKTSDEKTSKKKSKKTKTKNNNNNNNNNNNKNNTNTNTNNNNNVNNSNYWNNNNNS